MSWQNQTKNTATYSNQTKNSASYNFQGENTLPPEDSYTKLLIHANGSNGSTSFTDDTTSPKTITANGNAQISTAQSKFGGASALFDGSGDYLSVPDSADFDFSGGIWSVDCWIYLASLSDNAVIFSQSTDANNFYKLATFSDGSISLSLRISGVSSLSMSSSGGVVTTDNWYHIEVTENGNDYYIFVNGTLVKTSSDADRLANYTGVLKIGNHDVAYINGYIDEFRVSNGVARHTANFTPNTSPYNSN